MFSVQKNCQCLIELSLLRYCDHYSSHACCYASGFPITFTAAISDETDVPRNYQYWRPLFKRTTIIPVLIRVVSELICAELYWVGNVQLKLFVISEKIRVESVLFSAIRRWSSSLCKIGFSETVLVVSHIN